MSALNTDLYQLTMAAGYFAAGKSEEVATFELIVRRLPEHRNFLLTAGLAQAVEYLQTLSFDADEIAYIRSLRQFHNAPPEFFTYLSQLRFTGDLFTVPEGTPMFANEPIVMVRAPLIQAQLVETYLLSTFAFQTSVASKAVRCSHAAGAKPVIEFGTRRAHTPHAGVLAGRAAYIGGCAGTSNAEAGRRFGVPVSGTSAHSWTMAFGSEEQAFRQLQSLLGDDTVYLIDTYDTLEGARIAAAFGKPSWGVRLDSGDLATLAPQVRRILDDAGLQDMKIFATNDLDEHRIADLLGGGAPVDAFGVGTQLATSADAPALSAVYKMVELQTNEGVQYTAKFSGSKSTMPAPKQVFRTPQCDIIAMQEECTGMQGEPLLRPVLCDGELVEPLPSAAQSRDYAASAVARLPADLLQLRSSVPYKLEFSKRLLQLTEQVRLQHMKVPK